MATYCTAAEALAELEGVDASAIIASKSLSTQVTALLSFSKLRLDNACGRDFDAHTGTVARLSGRGSNVLVLDHYPVITLTKIEECSGAGSAETYATVASTLYRVDYTNGIVYFIANLNRESAYQQKAQTFASGDLNYQVTLDWGYATPPDDVKMAQAHMVRSMILSRIASADKSGEGSVQRIQVGTWSATFPTGSPYAGEIQQSAELIAEVVRNYRNVRL